MPDRTLLYCSWDCLRLLLHILIKGSGTAKVIITGDILDKDGNKIGDFHNTAMKALEAWEKVLAAFGIK